MWAKSTFEIEHRSDASFSAERNLWCTIIHINLLACARGDVSAKLWFKTAMFQTVASLLFEPHTVRAICDCAASGCAIDEGEITELWIKSGPADRCPKRKRAANLGRPWSDARRAAAERAKRLSIAAEFPTDVFSEGQSSHASI